MEEKVSSVQGKRPLNEINLEVRAVIAGWRPSRQLLTIDDLFNDRINYTVTNFEDLVRLNKEIHRVAIKYRMFEGSSRALAILQQFLSNFEILQQLLGEIEAMLQSVPSYKEEIVARLIPINQQIAEVNSWILKKQDPKEEDDAPNYRVEEVV